MSIAFRIKSTAAAGDKIFWFAKRPNLSIISSSRDFDNEDGRIGPVFAWNESKSGCRQHGRNKAPESDQPPALLADSNDSPEYLRLVFAFHRQLSVVHRQPFRRIS